MESFDILDYIRKIYHELNKTPLESTEVSLRTRYGSAMWIDNSDYNFVMCLCWIARTENVQWALWDRVRPIFKSEFDGDIRNIQTKEDCVKLGYPPKLVPHDWLPNLSKYLRRTDISFNDFLQKIKGKTGIEILDEFRSILGIKGEAKRVSVFIRDFLKKDVFPIDINVRYVLKSLGLPESEEMMVHLCKDARVDPKILERLFYRHGQDICGKGGPCPIKKLCLSDIFGLNRCK